MNTNNLQNNSSEVILEHVPRKSLKIISFAKDGSIHFNKPYLCMVMMYAIG